MPHPQVTDATFIRSPERWPRWPFLPVVKRDHHPRQFVCGLIFADGTFKVYVEANLFDEAPLKSAKEIKEYATPEALLADWRID